MTIIEFYDSTAMHNALSTLLLAPDRLVLFGADAREMYAFSRRLQNFGRTRGLSTQVHVVPIRTDTFEGLLERLEKLVKKYPDCAFDLAGGQTEILVAMGALSQKYGVPMHITDPARCRLVPFYGEDVYPPVRHVQLTAAEFIGLCGGKLTEAFSPSPSDTNFWQDVLAVWSVCRQNCRNWNTALSALHTFCSPGHTYKELDLQQVRRKLPSQKADAMLHTLRSLSRIGMLTHFQEERHRLSFQYKSPAVRRALSQEGAALELYTYYAAFVFNRRPVFSDAAIGLVMQWADSASTHVFREIKNEIDVFLMRSITPIFISCKNGFVDTDELYKLSVVSARFGGPYAKAAVVLTGHNPDLSFLTRAKELDIRIIQNAHTLSPDVFSDKIAEFATKI